VHLAWEAPETTELSLVGYVVYRDTIEEGTTTPDVLIFENIIGISNYTFYVSALYDDPSGIYNESGPSNMQTTE
jgi:hypothetical protein